MYQGSAFQNQGTMFAQQEQQAQAQPQAEAFDEEAFARAFDEAAQSELASEQAQQEGLAAQQDVLIEESANRFMESDHRPQERLGADLIYDPENGQINEDQNDPDALARTAGHLLDSVRDNQSDKFQNSLFLGLMRQLRDKKVVVEGDKIVNTQAHGGSAGLDESSDEVAAP
jgi:hypothetical protein